MLTDVEARVSSPVLIGRSAVACDYDSAAKVWEFAERETGTRLPG